MKSREELIQDIEEKIEATIKALNKKTYSDEQSDATNRLAIANFYIALSNLYGSN